MVFCLLENAFIPSDAKHLMVLPKARHVINHYHNVSGHSDKEHLLAHSDTAILDYQWTSGSAKSFKQL
jgi:hypothetical protein